MGELVCEPAPQAVLDGEPNDIVLIRRGSVDDAGRSLSQATLNTNPALRWFAEMTKKPSANIFEYSLDVLDVSFSPFARFYLNIHRGARVEWPNETQDQPPLGENARGDGLSVQVMESGNAVRRGYAALQGQASCWSMECNSSGVTNLAP